MKHTVGIILCAILLCFGAVSRTRAAEPSGVVAVSAGIAQCVEDIHRAFTAAGNPPLTFVKEATGPLAQKIDAGAPYDLLVAADPKWPQWLTERGKLRDLHPCARGHLVLWSQKKEFCHPEALQDRIVASPTPESTSHGKLAQAYLASRKLWNVVPENTKLILTGNALQAVMAVKAGSAEVALIPTSLAIEVGGSYVVLPADPIPTVGGLRAAEADPNAVRFWTFLRSSDASKIWERWGFEPLSGE